MTPPLTPKRLSNSPGIDGWYPYYAGFSLEFAVDALKDASGLILDPWAGSGTTNVAASRLGYSSIGMDLNPVAVVISKAKLARKPDWKRARETAHEFVKIRLPKYDLALDGSLASWLSVNAARRARGIRSAILEVFNVDLSSARIPRTAAFLLLCLIKACREVGEVRRASNPTWTASCRSQHGTSRALARSFLAWIDRLELDIGPSSGRQTINLGDARQMKIKDKTVAFVFGSPPYCTRIDYGASTEFELAVLGVAPAQCELLRKSLMGTTQIRSRPVPELDPEWPVEVRRLLSSIRNHRSHRSEAYYYKNFHQYFSDAWASMREVQRVLAPKGVARLVLQSSYYKEINIDLAEQYLAMARKLGMKGGILLSHPVSRTMASINSRSRHYLSERKYFESVIEFRSEQTVQ